MADIPIMMQLTKELEEQKNYDASIARCKKIISEIEGITKRRTITYFSKTNNQNPSAFINDDDSTRLEDILRVPSDLEGLDLILNSGGGYATSAERIINVCRNYIERNGLDEFRVIVPKLAKSAATIVSLGADKILLCENAELGPVDPQLVLTDNSGKKITKAAYHITNAVDALLNGASSIFPSKNEAFLIFLRQYNYDIYTVGKNELELSESIAKKILERKKDKYPEMTYESFDIFTDPKKTLSHGRLVGIDDLKNTPLCDSGFIEDFNEHYTDLGDENVKKLSNLIWELYLRKTFLVNDTGNPQVKVIESSKFMMISSDPEWKNPQNSNNS